MFWHVICIKRKMHFSTHCRAVLLACLLLKLNETKSIIITIHLINCTTYTNGPLIKDQSMSLHFALIRFYRLAVDDLIIMYDAYSFYSKLKPKGKSIKEFTEVNTVNNSYYFKHQQPFHNSGLGFRELD